MHAAFSVCAIVPTYDNPQTVEAVVARVREYLPVVIVVDDGSHAAARAAIDRTAATPGVVVVRRPQNGGKGAAMKSGLAQAAQRGFTHALQVDADGQHDLADIPRLVQAARDQPTALVLGAPQFDESRPAGRGFGHWLTIFWTHLETGSKAIGDPQCGFRVYPVAAAVAANVTGNRMDYDPEVVVRMVWAGCPIVNVPTHVRYLKPEDGGVSHFHMGWDNLLITWMHTRLVCLALLRLLTGRFRR